jgi:hypothetical protein
VLPHGLSTDSVEFMFLLWLTHLSALGVRQIAQSARPFSPAMNALGQKRRFDWRPVTSGLPRSTDILSLLRHATAAEPGGGGSGRIEGQRLGSDAITSPASASSRQGVTVNGSRSDHWATQR